MILNLRQAFLSVLYAAGLSWLLLYEIVPRWSYLLYSGEFSAAALAAALSFSAVLGALIPVSEDTKAMVVSFLHYIYFVPSVVYASFSDKSYYYIISFILLTFGIYLVTRIKVNAIVMPSVKGRDISNLVVFLTIMLVSAQAAFGGMKYFNLNIERVYEFRSISSGDVPKIFGYLFSNTANILIPIGLIFSFKSGKYITTAMILIMAILLFGMTHQKSVFFIPFSILLLYFCFSRPGSQYLVGLAFLGIPFISIVEVLYLRDFLQVDSPAYFTSYVVRRVLFTPPLLDISYVDYFSNHEKYFWSSSRLGSWASENPYGLTAPNVIGKVYFLNPEVSANTGIVGSGFAHAGILGVVLYSMIIGLLIAMLNSHGKRVGHEFIASTSVIIIFFIVTATDLSTALLSHGLLLLFVILSFFPFSPEEKRTNGTSHT